MNINVERIGVVGGGSWGTALALLLADNGYEIDLWVYEPELVKDIKQKRENTIYLPGFSIPSNIHPYNDFEPVVKEHKIILMVVPSHVYRSVTQAIKPYLADNTIIVSATKGIENETLLTMSGVWKEVVGDKKTVFSCLSGPSFAKEVARKIPTAVTIACDNIDIASKLQAMFANEYFRVYTSSDVMGLEIGGAVKNVIALAAGACDGLGLGHNTRAALITRGLAEMTRLGVAMGAHPITFLGLPGVGDLLLTCTGDLSRNRTVGYQIGQGKSLDEILSHMKMVAEGVKTAKSVYHLSKKFNIEMPICEQVYKILYEGKKPRDTVKYLMTRSLKHEWERELALYQQQLEQGM